MSHCRREECNLSLRTSAPAIPSLPAALLLFGLFPAGPAAYGATDLLNPPNPVGPGEIEERKWKEMETAPPPYPEDRNLIPVRMPTAYTLKVYVDEASLSVGQDSVIRFTMVAASQSGVRNVFYEGLRCTTREYKTYAVGTEEKTFAPVRKPKWERVPYYEINAFRFQLMQNYFCNSDMLFRVLTPHDFIQRLKNTTSE